MKIKKTKDVIVFRTISYVVTTLFALACLIPFVMMISGSLSSEKYIITKGYSIIPRGFNSLAYKILFQDPKILINAFNVSVLVTLIGTISSVFINSLTAYALCRKNFKFRNQAALFYYFTTLFNGGLVPYYIMMIKYYHLKNNPFVLIVPGIASVWNMLVLRNFIKNDIPESLIESSKIDGAGEFRIYWSIVLPLMKPALMAIGFFTAIGYWNDWYTPMLFIDKPSLYPLQYQLYRMLNTINFLIQNASKMNTGNQHMELPSETVKLAMAVIASAPIVFLYSFMQKYFVKGITIGAVKG